MNRIRNILYRHILHRNSKDEIEFLNDWKSYDSQRMNLLNNLADDEFIVQDFKRRSMVSYERPMTDMLFRINAIKRRRRITVLTWTVAASLLIAIVCSPYYIHDYSKSDSETIADNSGVSNPVTSLDSIKHGSTLATLHTSKGDIIPLSASDTLQYNMSAILAECVRPLDKDIELLSIEVPRGAEFKVVLEDSTTVWLNSQSSLVYPEVFNGSERKVQLIGEAYFEVATDSLRPFIVNAGSQSVRVYGTAFNIRAYGDEKFESTTLESGLVSIARSDIPSGEIKIRPGHQALFNKEDEKLNIRQVDPSVISSWRHGHFVFEELPLNQIMQDLSRWYNFNYEIPDQATADMVFMGSIPRYSDFKSAISILEKIGNLKFSTEDGKVIVKRMNF